MRETRPSGSVEGVMSNRDPYSDLCFLPDYRLKRLRRSYNTTSAEAQTIGRWYRRYFGSSQGDERRLQAGTIKIQKGHCSAMDGSVDCGSVCRGVRFRRNGNIHIEPSSLSALPRNSNLCNSLHTLQTKF